MADAPSVHVSIFGTDYTIVSETDPEHTRAVARYVDARMREVAGTVSLRSVTRVALLTAVNLADELWRERRAGQDLDASAQKTAKRLAERLGAAH
jgi:cell division protein ZapA